MEHFQWGGGGGGDFRGTKLGDTNFGPLKFVDFNSYQISNILDWG